MYQTNKNYLVAPKALRAFSSILIDSFFVYALILPCSLNSLYDLSIFANSLSTIASNVGISSPKRSSNEILPSKSLDAFNIFCKILSDCRSVFSLTGLLSFLGLFITLNKSFSVIGLSIGFKLSGSSFSFDSIIIFSKESCFKSSLRAANSFFKIVRRCARE